MLEELDLSQTKINDEEAIYLTKFLSNNKSLPSLSLSSNSDITTAGWRRLSAVLESPQLVLENLDLSECDLNDESFTFLTNALANNRSMKSLSLRRNWKITIAGWRTLSSVLQNPHSALEKLDPRDVP
mmetsp:Transcript_9716/g.17257  ORF Transcript_9716/g.17257 Transcript_9716/m.17257 type:complete len:128 (+) Transcript_9716:455-838(+)